MILLELPGWGLLLEDTTQLYLDLKIHSPTKNHTVRIAWVGFAASRHDPTISSDLIKTAPLKTILLEPPGWGLLLADTPQIYLRLNNAQPNEKRYC